MTFRLPLAAAIAALCLAAPVLAQPPAPDDPLPEAPGKDAVVRVCTACHDATQFAYARHTPEEWDMEITKMQGAGAEMTPEDQLAVSTYLSKTFPKPAPAAPAAAPAPS